MRIIGGSIFVLGGVVPLAWFITANSKHLKKNIVGFTGKEGYGNGQKKVPVLDKELELPVK